MTMFQRIFLCLAVGLAVSLWSATAARAEAQAEHGAAAAHEGETGHGGEHGSVNTHPLSYDPDLALATGVIFVLLFLVLWIFAWGPICKALDKREQGIAEQIEQAKQTNLDAQELLKQYNQRVEGTEQEVRQLLDQARREADTQRQQILNEAQAAAKAQADRAVREIESAKQAALTELAETSVRTAIDLAGRVVGRELKPADHSRLISESLGQMPSEN